MEEFNTQIATNIEQSKKLISLGLKPETADCMWYRMITNWKGEEIENPKWRFKDEYFVGFAIQGFEHFEQIPAWSLHRLIKIGFHKGIGIIVADDAFNSIINIIEKRIENNIFNKSYLKEC